MDSPITFCEHWPQRGDDFFGDIRPRVRPPKTLWSSQSPLDQAYWPKHLAQAYRPKPLAQVYWPGPLAQASSPGFLGQAFSTVPLVQATSPGHLAQAF